MGGTFSKQKADDPPPNKTPIPAVPQGGNMMPRPAGVGTGYGFTSAHLSRPPVFAFGPSAGDSQPSFQTRTTPFMAGLSGRPSIHSRRGGAAGMGAASSGRSVYDKLYRNPPASRHRINNRRTKLTAYECERLEEKARYTELLRKYTSATSNSSTTSRPVPTAASPSAVTANGRMFSGAKKIRIIDHVDIQAAFPSISSPMSASTPLVATAKPTRTLATSPKTSRVTELPPRTSPLFSRIFASSENPQQSKRGGLQDKLPCPVFSPEPATPVTLASTAAGNSDFIRGPLDWSRLASSRTSASDSYHTAIAATPGIGDRTYVQLQQLRAKKEKQQAAEKQASTRTVGSKGDGKRSAEVIDLDDDEDDVMITMEVPSPHIPIPVPPLARSPIHGKLMEELVRSPFSYDTWLKEMKEKYAQDVRRKELQATAAKVKAKFFEDQREEWEKTIEARIRHRLRLSEREPPAIKDEYLISDTESDEEAEDEFKELTEEQEEEVEAALRRHPPGQVLSEGYRLQITRADMSTLSGLNWLNDEVINFYMNQLMERGEQDNMPRVHAFNTFFYPKIMSAGQQGVKRWTKKVDLFSMDFILVPVHLGMHWCLAVINMKDKEINYYDSMGGNNDRCLNALKQYLMDESLDKKKQPFDTSGFKLTNVKNIPQQMNGSDCGMFACKFAECITRRAEITFTQDNMPYFRRRMVYEILHKKLL